MVNATYRFEIEPRGPFRLSESIRFIEGFPAAGIRASADAALRLAFVVDGTDLPAAVDIRQAEPNGPVLVGVTSDVGEDDVRRQVARLLSLDYDGSGFPDIGRRDPVVGRLQEEHTGFRPTGFWSPYEAAVWAITSHRVQMTQAAKVKTAIARGFGTTVHHDGQDLVAFPAPSVLAEADLSSVAGLSGRKPEWLRGIAHAARDGVLDAERLRSVPSDEAMATLRRLAGVGPFSAELILIRGAMTVDVAPAHEGRLLRAMAAAYDLAREVDASTLDRIVDGWVPFRTWTTVLMRTSLEIPVAA